MENKRLGQMLLDSGAIDASVLDFCLSIQKNNGGKRLGEVLRHYDFVRDEIVTKALAEQVGWEVFKGSYIKHEAAFDLLGLAFCREHMIFPSAQGKRVIFVMAAADNIAFSDNMQRHFGASASFAMAPAREILEQLDAVARNVMPTAVLARAITDNINEWFEEHLKTAIQKGATDIHIEPSVKAVEMRLRIDGLLHFSAALPLKDLPRLVNVIFHKAEVTVSDFARFHDARFTYNYMDKVIDIRLSHIPAVHGSSIVLRLLDKSRSVLSLTELGYGADQWGCIGRDLRKPEGMMLIVGPTGSGKSTSLYAMINHIKHLSRKIVSIEDPVEIHMPLVTQVQINEKRGIHFHESIRAFLRHDPDVMLIGEIRDSQTASEAMRASMTGHKVFATLHTRSSTDALLRLHDLGVPWINMANNITTIISQRLVRKLCPHCKRRAGEAYEAVGCSFCLGGYSGRTAVSEILAVDEAIAALIAAGDMAGLMKAIKTHASYSTLRHDGERLIGNGVTSVAEAERVLG